MITEAKKGREYEVRVGINWPDGKGGERRAEPGDTVTAADLKTAKSGAGWFLRIGAIVGKGGDE